MRKVHGNKCSHQETRKIPNKQPNFTPPGTRKLKTNKIQL